MELPNDLLNVLNTPALCFLTTLMPDGSPQITRDRVLSATTEGAAEHIDKVADKYLGRPYRGSAVGHSGASCWSSASTSCTPRKREPSWWPAACQCGPTARRRHEPQCGRWSSSAPHLALTARWSARG